MRVLGIDPGLRVMGWGLIAVDGSRLSHIAHGTLSGDGTTLSARLMALHDGLCRILRTHAPDGAAVEQTFVNRDGAGTLKLGQARGVALLALAQAGLEPGEYAPNAVKKAVVGVGHADKRQVQHMVRLQLPGCDVTQADAADALAIAICHSHHMQSAGTLAQALARAAS